MTMWYNVNNIIIWSGHFTWTSIFFFHVFALLPTFLSIFIPLSVFAHRWAVTPLLSTLQLHHPTPPRTNTYLNALWHQGHPYNCLFKHTNTSGNEHLIWQRKRGGYRQLIWKVIGETVVEENDWDKPKGLCCDGAFRYVLRGSSSGQVRKNLWKEHFL